MQQNEVEENKNMYNPKSGKATEFIDDREILDSLEYAQKNKNNKEVIDAILEKASAMKGISHREAAVLLECELEEENKKIEKLAKEIKQRFYGNRIVMFAPLYLSNYCVNGCTYCPYHHCNEHIRRKKLTQDEIRDEVITLQDMGSENNRRLFSQNGNAEKLTGSQDFTYQAYACERERETEPHSDTVKQGRDGRILGSVAFRTA